MGLPSYSLNVVASSLFFAGLHFLAKREAIETRMKGWLKDAETKLSFIVTNENEAKKLSDDISNLENEIQNLKNEYDKIISNTTQQIEEFVQKANLEN